MMLNVYNSDRRTSRSSRRGSATSLLISSPDSRRSRSPSLSHSPRRPRRSIIPSVRDGQLDQIESGRLQQQQQIEGVSPERRPVAAPQVTRVTGPVDVDAARVLIGIGRAILARLLFIVHSLATIWTTVDVQGNDSVWAFALISLFIILEGSYTIIMRAGDERKWFCTSVFLYVLATAPPIWILESKLCQWRRERLQGLTTTVPIADPDNELRLQLLEQLMLVVLIIGRWLLPKGDISREQLSQILLAYLAISSDIVEFFDVFKERPVFVDPHLQTMVLVAWTLSLLQFPFVLTVSRARKMRVAITKTYEELVLPRKPGIAHICYDLDIWAIVLANSLQDIPFLLVRLYLMFDRGLITYTMLFFTCKNALIIALQTYRAFVLINDRYVHPRPPRLEAPLRAPRSKQAHKKKRHRRERSEELESLCKREDREDESTPRRSSKERGEAKEKRREKERPKKRRDSGADEKRSERERLLKTNKERENRSISRSRSRSNSRVSPPQAKEDRQAQISRRRSRSESGDRHYRLR